MPGLPRSVGFGQLAAVLGPDAPTVDDHVQVAGGHLGIGPGHAQQHGVDPRQHGRVAPLGQPPTQGRARGAAVAGGEFTPLDTLTQKEPQGFDNIRRGKARPSPLCRFSFKSFDDPSNQSAYRYYQLLLLY